MSTFVFGTFERYLTVAKVGDPTVINTVTYGSGDFQILGISPDGSKLIVPDYGDAQVLVIDSQTLATLHTLTGASQPWQCIFSADGLHAYVTDNSQQILTYETTGWTLTQTITTAGGIGPEEMCLSADGHTGYVTDFNNSNLLICDLVGGSVTHTVALNAQAGDAPEGICLNAAGTKAYVCNNNLPGLVYVVDLVALTFTTISVGENPYQIVLSLDGTKMFVACSTNTGVVISVINPSTNTVTSTITAPAGYEFTGVATLSPDGSTVIIGSKQQPGYASLLLYSESTGSFESAIHLGFTPDIAEAFQGVVAGPLGPPTYQAVSAYGAGYARSPSTNIFQATSAYGSGFASLPLSGATPIPPTTDGYAFLLRNRTARATGHLTLPPAPPGELGPGGFTVPAPDLASLGIPRSSETYDPPVVLAGIPYADAERNPWLPAETFEVIWATQLQIVVNGEDVSFFRATPTIVESWSSQEPFGDASAVVTFPAITSFDQLRQPLAVPTGATVGMAPTYTRDGYWTASALGLVSAFGDATYYGDPLNVLNSPITGIAASTVGYGYALCAADGGVFCFNVPFHGSLPGIPLVPPRPIVGIALTGTGNGYWLIDAQGDIYAFGDAPYYGNAPLTGGDTATAIACAPANNGYTMLSANGHVWGATSGGVTEIPGGAPFYVAPFVGLCTTPSINGYVLVNTLGEAYAFFGLNFEGSITFPLNAPANSIATHGPNGYWIGAEDGGVFAFGDAPFYGSVVDGGTTAGGSTSWIYLGAPITINRVIPEEGLQTLFEGVIADWEDAPTVGHVGLSVQIVGCLFQLDWYIAKPILNLPFQGYNPETGNPVFGWDIAQAIPAAINSVTDPSPGTALGAGPKPGPRPTPFNGNACVLNLPGGASQTGVFTITQPAWDKLLTGYIQNVLSQAENLGGTQYTVALQRPRTPVLQQKDFLTVKWTVSTGGHGIAPDLSLDISTAANAIYGSGTAPPVYSTLGSANTQMGVAGTWQGGKYPQIPSDTLLAIYVVAIIPTYTGNGYWLVASTGLILNYGDAPHYPTFTPSHPIVGASAHPSAYGFVTVGSDGGIFTYGACGFHGSIPGGANPPYNTPIPLPAPIVAVSLSFDGNGYFLLDSQGAVYAFGSAAWEGNAPISAPDSAVAIVHDFGFDGYYVFSALGATYAIPPGTPPYYGNIPLTSGRLVVAAAPCPTSNGYVVIDNAGEAFAYGGSTYHGNYSGAPLNKPMDSVAIRPDNSGYWMGAQDGGVFTFSTPFYGSAVTFVGPPFPLAANAVYAPGDGQTGFKTFSDWMRQCGWPLSSQDTYLSASPAAGVFDYYLILMWQLAAGLEQTGEVDINTWNAAFIVGSNAGALANTWYAPLWEIPEVEPYTYTPSGAFNGINEFYNPAVPRVERYEAMGQQTSKAQGILSAITEGTRIQVPAWTGTIKLTSDPQEGSRFEIIAGQNILLRFWHGRDVLFHISAVNVDFTNGSVALTVSAQPLDLITLAAIYARDTQAHGVSRVGRPSLVNLNVSPNTTTFDSESGAGQLYPVVCPAGQWVVVQMAASQYGSFAGAALTSYPASPFAVAVFSGPVTPADLAAIFTLSGGSPLQNDIATGNNPWNDFANDLDALGLLYAAGGPGGPCGFYPSDPNGTQTLTGQYVDGQTWPYFSSPGYAPWLWVALWAQSSCFISGRFLPAPTTPA